MLYSLIATVIALSFFMPFMCFIAFRKGYEVGRGKDPEIKVPEMPAIFRKPKEDPHIKRFNAILDNINTYSGGPEDQRTVK